MSKLETEHGKHYELPGGMKGIEVLEAIFTKEELMAWARITAMKYRLRIGKKDDPIKELQKIESYELYYEDLKAQYEIE